MTDAHSKIPVLDHGYVWLIGTYPDHAQLDYHPLLTPQELAVVSAARVSFGAQPSISPTQDEKLLRYLIAHKHLSPFEIVRFHVGVYAPTFVANQLMRYRTGSYNAFSYRYADPQQKPMGLHFYAPSELRGQSADNKQASDGVIDNPQLLERIRTAHSVALNLYNDLLAAGVARELARTVLPVSMYTLYNFQLDARNLYHLLEERLANSAQWETQQYAQAIFSIFRQFMPIMAEGLAAE